MMKTLVAIVAALGCLSSAGPAQTAAPTRPASAPPQPPAAAMPAEPSILRELPELSERVAERAAAAIRSQAAPSRRVLGRLVEFSGALPQARRTGHPLQLINPFAPADYGHGFDNVAVNPATGRAEGLALFAIRW